MKSHLTFSTFHEIISPPSVLPIYQILIKSQVDINWEEFRNKTKGCQKTALKLAPNRKNLPTNRSKSGRKSTKSQMDHKLHD